jgi:hypothetical protein
MQYKHLIAGSAAAALMLTAGLVALPALADTSSTTSAQTTHIKGVRPAAFGTVSAVSGNIITLTSKMKNATTTYSVDATNAIITKGIGKSTTTITASGITVGDRLVVQGTVSGTSITATSIRDGLAHGRMGKGRLMKGIKGVHGGHGAKPQ